MTHASGADAVETDLRGEINRLSQCKISFKRYDKQVLFYTKSIVLVRTKKHPAIRKESGMFFQA